MSEDELAWFAEPGRPRLASNVAVKAHRLHAQASISTAPLRWEEAPDPEPGPREVRVRVSACAICRTDLHVIEGDLPPRGLPRIPGHQVVGTVDRLGAGCSRLSLGERVGIAWLRQTCGECAFCRRGEENLCPRSEYTGWHADGGYAELTTVPEAYAYRLPASFTDVELAPLLCAGIIGYRALERSRLPPKGTLALYGFGSSAHVTLQVARHLGATVYVSTRDEKHQRLARELGAAWVGGGSTAPPVLVDSAIVFAPAGALVPLALTSLRPGGTLALAGIHMSAVPSLDYDRHLFHEKTITSVEANTRDDGEALLALASRIPVVPRCETFTFSDANRALRQLASDGIQGTGVLVR